jgi:hypothetical protein
MKILIPVLKKFSKKKLNSIGKLERLESVENSFETRYYDSYLKENDSIF